MYAFHLLNMYAFHTLKILIIGSKGIKYVSLNYLPNYPVNG